MVRVVTNIWWRLVRAGFWLLYNPFAFIYDGVSWVVSMGAWREWTRTSLRHLPPGDGWILELAHGTGNLQSDLHAQGRHIIGYDLSPAMGRIAQRKLIRAGYTPHLIRGTAQQLPFSDGQFTAIISTFPTDFIVSAETLREVRRVLAPGGLFIVVPGAAFTGGGVGRRILDVAYRVTGQRTSAPNNSPTDATNTGDVEPLREHIESFSFHTAVYLEPCRRSVAYVIVGEKAVDERG